MITEERYLKATGFSPRDDDLERCNCEHQGKLGHWGCGWCEVCEKPMFFFCEHFHAREKGKEAPR